MGLRPRKAARAAHAGYWENAYYDRESGALHFFYFEGPNGKPVYTCLSHDIVTHELGHAILDGLKPYYNEVSSPDTAGFHEYFGDAVAMTAGLTHREIAVDVVGRMGGLGKNISSPESRRVRCGHQQEGLRGPFRTLPSFGDNTLTMDDLEGVYEEHDYALVLVEPTTIS